MKTEYTAATWPSDRWPNFSHNEMKCRHSNRCFLDAAAMDALQEMRTATGKSMRITSGYRHSTHPIEAAKVQPGAHYTGKAFDIAAAGYDALLWMLEANSVGFTGFGVKQHGTGRFLHIDMIEAEDNFHAPRPALWSYPA